MRRIALSIGSGLALTLAARAANAPVDADLLEFLGTVDSEEAGWHDYLGDTDVSQVADPGADKVRAPKSDLPAPKAGTPQKVET